MKNKKLNPLACLMAAACLFCGGATAGTFKSITIDGSFGDWTGVPLLHTSPTNSISTTVVDYKDIYVANDDNYLYIRFTLYKSDDPFTSLQNIFMDADNNGLTGYGAGGYVGSEMLIQGGSGYQEKNGGFNEDDINGLGWLAAPVGVGTEFEARISRSATYASDSLPVFASPTIAFVLEAEIAYTPTEWAPATIGGITYTFEAAPSPLTTNVTLINLNQSWQANASGTDLGVAWLDQSYDDTAAGWNAGAGLFGYTPSPGAYPAINTALSSGPTTYYFRTHFNWNFLNNNVAFVITNYLSDGAVVYLNGAEVRSIRMPAGTVGYATNATGSASPVGQVDVFGISDQALILGDNILEVETHQAPGTGADMVFGLSLTAAAQYAVLNSNTNLPANQSVVAGQTVTMSTDVVGSGPLGYQWSKNGVPIPGATTANYVIPVVLTNDAGNYVLVTTNSFNTNTTRTAVLTVTSTPVTFNDPAQPADAYTLEGQAVTLGVTMSGSPLIQYQWFKGASSILGATNASYTIANPVSTDSGNYFVTVNNPSGSINSRTNTLTVLADKVPPSVTSAVASATGIVVTFSSPVDSVTANVAGHYTLSGGLTVSSAVINPGDATKVTLTTSSAMTLGTVYQLTVTGVADLFGNTASSTASFTRTITIDGSFSDWQGVAPSFSGPIGFDGAADFKDIYVYSDASRYYFRVTLWHDLAPGDGQFPAQVNMFFDTDNNANTGFGVFGSEILIQSGFSYQEKNGGFNEGPISGLNWTCLPAAPGTNFEFSVSRAATFDSDSTLVFPTNYLNFVFQGQTIGWVALNLAPASGVISFTNTALLNVPGLPLGRISILGLTGGKAALAWDLPGTLQARGSLTSGTWTNVPAASSPYVIPAGGTQLFFRLTN
jgi:hypothetical protein